MAVYLHDKYADEIQSKFVRESLITGRLSDVYSFSGVKTVKVTTPVTVPMVDYTRSGANRYGTPAEMQDIVQELTLSQDKSFAMTIDKGNNSDQSGVKEAGRMLSLQIAEQAVPTMDKYCFKNLVHKAGKLALNAEALTRETICARITEGTVHMDDAEVPSDNRTLYVPSATYAMLRLSDEFQKCENLLDKSLAKGQVGTYDGMAVVKVPASRWPENVNFLIVHKSAACAPVKLNDTKLHQDPPGISGALLEGRQYYDLFVFGAKCDGVYAELDTAGGAKVTEAPTLSGGTLSSATDGVAIKYTVDGTDPRYSNSAVIGTSVSAASGSTVKAYAYKEGYYPSAVSELEV